MANDKEAQVSKKSGMKKLVQHHKAYEYSVGRGANKRTVKVPAHDEVVWVKRAKGAK